MLPAVRPAIRITLAALVGLPALAALVGLPALAALVGLATTGCHARPAPGETCRVADQFVCASRADALVCEPPPGQGASSPAPAQTPPSWTPAAARTWTAVPCKGAKGCARAGGEDECDDTLASEGDPCPRNPPLDYACATDLATALVCKDGRFGLWRRCRGPQGCRVVDGRNVHCDTLLGEAGDPCERAGTFACSVDGKTMLECDGNALAAASSCRGPMACFFEKREAGAEPHKINCDDGVAQEGDPCIQARRITCALDHKEELVCDGHRFGKKRDCRKSDCRVDGTELFCD